MLTPEERINNAESVLKEQLEQVAQEAKTYEQRAARERSLHTWFSACLAILSVAAPAVVTYQTQQTVPSFWIAIAAIAVTSIAGAGSALQSTFKWGDRFRRTRLTALELGELASNTKLQKFDILDSNDDIKKFQKLYELNQAVAKDLQAILRKHIEAEVALVTQPPVPSLVSPTAAVAPPRG